MTPARKLGDLRKPRGPAAVPPPGGLPPGLAGGPDRLPLLPGQVLLTDLEKAELGKAGWKPGDPIPANFANVYAAVAAARREADAPAAMPPLPPGVKDLVPPPVQDISALSGARQDALAQALTEAKVQLAAFEQQKRMQVPGAAPGVNEAIAAGLADVLVDDLAGRKVAAPPQPPPSDDRDLDARPGAGGAALPKECPHCGWDRTRAEAVEATADDKLRWLIAQEGGGRFTKECRLLGGRMVVVFRSLTAMEADTAFRQIAVDGARDLRASVPETEGRYWRDLMSYRLAMATESVWTAQTGPQHNVPLAEWQVDPEDCPPPNTKLHAVYPAVVDALFPTEALRRQIGAAHHRFQLLVEHLEAHADDDSFWSGIGQPS